MKFSSDKELFKNLDSNGRPVFGNEQVSGSIRYQMDEMKSFNKALDDKERFARIFEKTPEPETLGKIREQILEKVDMSFAYDTIFGFPRSKLDLNGTEFDYFKEHAGSDTQYCFGAFNQLRDIYRKVHHWSFHLVPLLFVLAALYALYCNTAGHISFWTGVLLIAAPVAVFMSDLSEEGWLLNYVCHPLTVLCAGGLTIIGLLNNLASQVPYMRPIFLCYYLLVVLAILLDYIRQVIESIKSAKYRKQFVKNYKELAPMIHRYIRYHAIWWAYENPNAPLPDCIKDMQREFDFNQKLYRKYR